MSALGQKRTNRGGRRHLIDEGLFVPNTMADALSADR